MSRSAPAPGSSPTSASTTTVTSEPTPSLRGRSQVNRWCWSAPPRRRSVRTMAVGADHRFGVGAGRLAGAAVALALSALGHAAPSAGAPHPIEVGFGDKLFISNDPSARENWFDRAGSTGASIVRVNVHWSAVAPVAPPPGFDARDPSAR